MYLFSIPSFLVVTPVAIIIVLVEYSPLLVIISLTLPFLILVTSSNLIITPKSFACL